MTTLNDEEKATLNGRYFDLMFVDDVRDCLCVRCKRVVICHWMTNCGHLLCGQSACSCCQQCPTCKQSINQLTQDPQVDAKLSQLNVHCLNFKNGCDYVGTLKQLMAHMRGCIYTRRAALWTNYKARHRKDPVARNVDSFCRMSEDIVKRNDDQWTQSLMANEEQRHQQMMECKMEMLELRMKSIATDNLTNSIIIKNEILDKCCEAINEIGNELKSEQHNFKSELMQLHESMSEKLMIDIKGEIERMADSLKENVNNQLAEIAKQFAPPSLISKRCINILLVGESRNGKSTLINAFANCCAYKTFEEAVSGDEICIIPTKFTCTDDDYNEIEVKGGADDPNECLDNGRLGTLSCKSYVFNIDDCLQMRWIDSPGMASLKNGPEQDENNVRDILNYIGQYEELSAIALVISGNQARMTDTFQYCIHQILSMFHRDAAKNIIFVFTHSHQPNDSFQTLKACLKQMQPTAIADIKTDNNNFFNFDNDAFRSILKQKRGVSSDNTENSSISWGKNLNEFQRLLENIVKLEPHDAISTIDFNRNRRLADDVSLIVDHVTDDIEQLKEDVNSNVVNTIAIENNVRQLEEEKKTLLKAVNTLNSYVKDNAILEKNIKKQEHVKQFNRSQTDWTKNASKVDLDSDRHLLPDETCQYPVGIVQIEALKKQLVLMGSYGTKFSCLLQLEQQSQKPVKKSREKIVAIKNKHFTVNQSVIRNN